MNRFASILVSSRVRLLVCVVALAATVSLAEAGRLPTPGKANNVCQAHGSVTYYDTFGGGQLARVAIVGDGSTDLDIYVYTMQGQLVAQGIGLTDVELVSWWPAYTQTYRIVVRNLGSTWNRYSLATN